MAGHLTGCHLRRGEGHGSGPRGAVQAKDVQRFGLGHPVGPHDTDNVSRRDRQVRRLEEIAAVLVAAQARGNDEDAMPPVRLEFA